MEAHAQSIENHLIEGLDFSLGSGANYVTSRRSVTYQTTGGNLFSPAGIKVIRFQITGQEEFLDPATSRLVFTISNTSGTLPLKPASTYSFFRRMRLLVNGVLMEDIDFYAKTYKTFEMLSDRNYIENLEAEGVSSDPASVDSIAANSSRIVCMPLLSGLLSQEKYVMLKVAPITLELELYSDATQSVRDEGGSSSASYALSDVQFKCDVVELDNGLANDYYSHLLQGKSLPIHYVTYTTISQVANAPEVNIQVSRSLTRMKSIFISLVRNNRLGGATDKKEFEEFYHPMLGTYDFTKEMEIEVQLGSNRYPVYPIRSVAESFYQLKKTIGLHGSAHHAISIPRTEYNDTKFVVGLDFEKILDRLMTGENTKNGNMLTIKIRNTGLDSSSNIGMCYVTLMYDSICSIQDSGVLNYD